jgi:glycosyltransferase involved in cell wall biosynthesis
MGDELASYDFVRPRWVANALARLLDAFVPRVGTRCIPHSTNIEKFFHGMGLSDRTEPIVNFGIDVDWVARGDGSTVCQRYDLGSGSVILYTGVLDQFQRLDLLLEAVAKIILHEPRVKLLVVVTVPQEKHLATLRARAEALQIAEHVVLTEPQALSSVRDFLKACDVAVVPRPQAPGFPIKLLNYMAAARPCVLFASSGSQGLSHRHNVFLASPDTSDALGEAILEVLRDSELRQRLASNGHQFVRLHHDRLVIAQKVCDGYVRTLKAVGRWLPPSRPLFESPPLPRAKHEEGLIGEKPEEVLHERTVAEVPHQVSA